MIYLILFLFFFYILFDALQDAYIIGKRGVIHHEFNWILRAITGTIAALAVEYPSAWESFQLALLLMMINWLLFDLFLNWARDLKWNYVGETAFWDGFFRLHFKRNPERTMIISKAIGILITLLLYLH